MSVYTLITGASKGIGRSMAFACAAKGMNLIICARSTKLLEDLATEIREKYQVVVKVYALDLVRPDAAKQLANFCVRHHLNVNMLINNAGFGLWGAFADLPLEDQVGSIQLNVSALVTLTHGLLPLLTQQRQSYILNIASIAGFMPSPYFSVYAATKAFVVSFSRALRVELKKSGVVVSCLCPGPTESEFAGRAGMENFRFNKKEFYMNADLVAKIGLDGLLKKRDVIIPGASNKFTTALMSALPKSITSRVIGKIYKP